MNYNNQLFDLIRKEHCPSCGASYDVKEIKFLGKFNSAYLLQLICKVCKLPSLVSIFISDSRPKTVKVDDLTQREYEKFKSQSPVSNNEIIDLHNFLKKFKGDVSSVLK